jgi:SAM-dependent methyltransferase
MTHDFDKDYWEHHWQERHGGGSMGESPANPYLLRELGAVVPGTALDAGCGAGAEALWLSAHGWRVTAADISSEALGRAADREAAERPADPITWVRADLTTWEPDTTFDLVTTHYAHPSMPQAAFYERVASWVAPGGTLLIVGHLQTHGHGGPHGHDHGPDRGHRPPDEATVTAATITALLDPHVWDVVTAEETQRMLGGGDGHGTPLHDVVVRATRRH